jgi:uncharacterized iron-regulated membrane protein
MQRRQHAKILRLTRKIHRITGISLFLLFFVMSLSGLLLGWKKNSGGLIHPGSATGSSRWLSEWKPLDTLATVAISALEARLSLDQPPTIDRMDVRPDKGIIKFRFKENFWGVQVDGATGEVLQIARRNHDWIEQVHDGSILNYLLGTDSDVFKLFYTSLTGLALLLFVITGFWLWYGPRVMRHM